MLWWRRPCKTWRSRRQTSSCPEGWTKALRRDRAPWACIGSAGPWRSCRAGRWRGWSSSAWCSSRWWCAAAAYRPLSEKKVIHIQYKLKEGIKPVATPLPPTFQEYIRQKKTYFTHIFVSCTEWDKFTGKTAFTAKIFWYNIFFYVFRG